MLTVCKSKYTLAIRVKELALTFGTGRTPDHLWMSSNIINDWSLDSRDLKVPSFSKNCLTNTTEGIELESSVTRFNFKNKKGSDRNRFLK